MINPTQELVKEHSAISTMLQVLQTVCNRMEKRAVVPTPDLSLIVEFLIGFADGCHHRKEELCLFPLMEQAGVPRQGGPIGVMLAEHELARKYIRGMKEAITARSGGDSGAEQELISHARAYCALLSMHIHKENNILFPIAEQRVAEDAKQELVHAFQRVDVDDIGAARHEHFRALLDDLRKKYPAVSDRGTTTLKDDGTPGAERGQR